MKVLFYKDIYAPDNATIAEVVSHLILDGNKSILLNILQIFDKRIVDITTIVDNKIPYVYVILTDKQKLPITYMGDGINKMLQLLLCVITTPQGIVLTGTDSFVGMKIGEAAQAGCFDFSHDKLNFLQNALLRLATIR